jgi:hypothetical protein
MVAAVPVAPVVTASRHPVRPPRHRARVRLRCPGRRHPLRRPLPRQPRQSARRARHPPRPLRRRPVRVPAPCPVCGQAPVPARQVPRGRAGLPSSLSRYRHPRRLRPLPRRRRLPPCRNRFASSPNSPSRRGRLLPLRPVASPATTRPAVSLARWYRPSGSPPSPARVPPGPATTRSASAAVPLLRLRRLVVPGQVATGRHGQVAIVRLRAARVVIVRHPVAAANAVRGPVRAACRPGPTRA